MDQSAANFRPPTPVDFDTSDKPSMGDPEFVDGMVREMLDEVRKALFEAPEGSNPQDAVVEIAKRWRDKFWAGNPDYIQTLSVDAQNVWLKDHNLGTQDHDEKAGVGGLVVATLDKFVRATTDFADHQIDEDQLQFSIDTAVEDCTCMLLGIENPAD